jgi:ABC-type glycerol-3-phosphate transport system substrate-binding protein
MSLRRSILGLVGAAAIALAACSSGSPSGSSGVLLPNPASLNPASLTAGLQGFCADVASKITASWPNVDTSTATSLAPVMQQWAAKPEVASVQADIAKIAVWLSSMGSGGAAASPPADVQTAFDHLKTFAGTNC